MLSVENRINSKKELKDWLKYESDKYSAHVYGASLRNIFLISENDVLRKHQILLRTYEYYLNTNNGLLSSIYKIRLFRFQNKYSLHISPNTCGKGLRIMHVGPVLINGFVTVGRDCSIHINTALVAGGVNEGVPTIGNNVVIGVGAVVLGEVNIAEDIAIGANAVVNKDFFEKNIAIAGVPARKVSNNGSAEWNKSNIK